MNSMKQALPMHLFSGIEEKNSRNQSSAPRRVLWMAIFFTCVSIMSLQVYDRVSYYNQVPVSTVIKYVQNETMIMPHMTICPSDYRRPDVEKTMMKTLRENLNKTVSSYDLLLAADNLTDLWDDVSYKFEDIVQECLFRGERCERGSWKTLRSLRGNCFTFSPPAPLLGSGPYHGLHLLLHDVVNRSSRGTFTYKILLHNPNDSPLWDTFTRGVFVYHAFVYDIRIRVKQLKLLNTTRKLCNQETTSSCSKNYIDESLMKSVGCRLPFMPNSSGRLCSTPAAYRSADEFVRLQLVNPTVESACIQECEQIIYEINVDSTQYTDPTATRVRVFYDQFIYEEMREEHLYGLVAMLCDIGGSLGLFLGASVLTLVQIVEIVIRSLREKYTK